MSKAKERAREILVRVWANHGIITQEETKFLQENCFDGESSFDKAIILAKLQDEYERSGRPTWSEFVAWWNDNNPEKAE